MDRQVKPWDVLKKENWTDQEIRLARLAVCKACPELTAFNFCRHCNCFMPSKTLLQKAKCPINKW